MTAFIERYKKLNKEQRQAVDTIDGPLLVVAGPGTGKTELLSMRAANILRLTDTLPENILCLTFTESGANAMRQRLASIIGPAAYKIAIHTFHGFGTDVINQYRDYFYHGAEFEPADDIARHELLTGIFDELDHTNPLAAKFNGEYVHLYDTAQAISELKQAGLTSDELRSIIAANEALLDEIEPTLSTIFADKPVITMLDQLASLAKKIAEFPKPTLPPTIAPLADELSLSLAHAIDAALETKKTPPITKWRNQWLEQNDQKAFVFKDRKKHSRLRALAPVYFSYLNRMDQAGLFDYDDMILNLVHGMDLHKDLKANLQERYQYIMVDEFQDTNRAQLRILFRLTENPLGDAPNVMAVGDDDQAIYSFQGADLNNIHSFREQYPSHTAVVLTQNYRSSQQILDHSRDIAQQISSRLETTLGISKKLTANTKITDTACELTELPTIADEYSWVADAIATQIASGVAPHDITVLARKHQELLEFIPYLHHHDIAVNYEHRDNVLDMAPVQTLELLAKTTVAIFSSDHQLADSLLPELLSHPMFALPPETIWKLSITAQRNHTSWLETMLQTLELKTIAAWLLERAKAVPNEPLEQYLDVLIGIPTGEPPIFRSPYYDHYFSKEKLTATPDAYITMLEALRTIRTHLRDYQPDQTLHVTDFLEFIQLHRELGSGITSIRTSSSQLDDAVNVMTAHKSKGLEFDTVYLLDSVDSVWGERVRTKSRFVNFPENMPISPNAGTYDDRLRLYYVAMTRAKRQLYLCYSLRDAKDKESIVASFLTGTNLPAQHPVIQHTIASLTALNTVAWHDTLIRPTSTLRELLAPTLEHYKLSATHLNNFLDVTRGGPQAFLMNNLLRFPQAKSASACFGTAVHATLQRAHVHFTVTGERRPVEDVLGDFIHELERQRLNDTDFALYSKRGTDALAKFLAAHYQTFTRQQKAELQFAGQGAAIEDALLTGSLDLVDINDNAITVTDYKTGKPAYSWKGNGEHEHVKLHRYRQQLMFYQLLTEQSRDYARYDFAGAVLQFVEPDSRGDLHSLTDQFSRDELNRFKRLITIVWHNIMTLELPDSSAYDPTYKGILQFEKDLLGES